MQYVVAGLTPDLRGGGTPPVIANGDVAAESAQEARRKAEAQKADADAADEVAKFRELIKRGKRIVIWRNFEMPHADP